MSRWIGFWNILAKDMRSYYLKPPNISWGLIFPFAWTGMFLIRSGGSVADVLSLLPGVIAISVLFGTTSMLAVTITFEKKGRSFERLLLAPIPLEVLMIAKTAGAVIFGVANAFVPIVLSAFLVDLSGVAWGALVSTVFLVAVSSTFVGLFVAVAVNEVFEAQTFSNFLRFPMIFLCGLFFPLEKLPWAIRPLSYVLPLTYGVDAMRGAVLGTRSLPLAVDLPVLAVFCVGLFFLSLRDIRRKWIV